MGFLPAINVVVAGAAARVAQYLLYNMCDGRVFGTDQLMRLFLLEVPSKLEQLKALLSELKTCCFPLIEDLVATDDPPTAFQDADVAILLTAEVDSAKGMTQAELLRNVKVFRNHGLALEEFSRKSALVVVAAEGPAAAYSCVMAAVCARSAPSIPKQNFSAVSRLLQDWAAAKIAGGLRPLTQQNAQSAYASQRFRLRRASPQPALPPGCGQICSHSAAPKSQRLGAPVSMDLDALSSPSSSAASFMDA